ncbi:MAG: carboxypeptidase regulatory-like domain-containing protein [Kiritimatiellales bacterium]|nr:carboxypeptidase regulatory-like domain-containing protein [Kiritimatiellales bacterium]
MRTSGQCRHRLWKVAIGIAAVGMCNLLLWPMPVSAAETTRYFPLHFEYEDGDASPGGSTDWQTLIPKILEGKIDLGGGNVPVSLNLSGHLAIRYDPDEIYSLPGGDRFVPVDCWITLNDDPVRTEISSQYGVEAGISIRPKFGFKWPELGFGKDFMLNDSRDGICPLGNNTLGCIDVVEFLSIPLSDVVGPYAKNLSKVLSATDDAGLGMASMGLVGELAVTGDFIDAYINGEYIKFFAAGEEHAQEVMLCIPANYVLDMLVFEPRVSYQCDIYQGIGYYLTLIDPLTLTISPALLARGEIDIVNDYKPPTLQMLADYYNKAASNVSVSDSGSPYIRIPMSDTPSLPDLQVTELKIERAPSGLRFADEPVSIGISIYNRGTRDTDINSRSYLYLVVNGERIFRQPIHNPAEGAWHTYHQGESFRTNLQYQFSGGINVVETHVSYVEYQYTDGTGFDWYATADACLNDNAKTQYIYVHPDRGWIRGQVQTLPADLPEQPHSPHVVSNMLVRLTGPDYVQEMTTGTDGLWAFEGMPSGVYELNILPPGPQKGLPNYWPRSYMFYHGFAETDDFSVDARFQTTSYEHHLLQMQAFSGCVVDDHFGTPVSNVTVCLGQPAFMIVATGADGSFSMDNVPPRGIYTLHFRHPQYECATQTVDMASQVTDTTVERFISSTPGDPVLLVSDSTPPTLEAPLPVNGLYRNAPFNVQFRSYDHHQPTHEYRWRIRSSDGTVTYTDSGWLEYPHLDGETWQFVEVSTNSLPDAAYGVVVQVRDANHNSVATVPSLYTLDTIPPAVTVTIADGATLINSGSTYADIDTGETAGFARNVWISFNGTVWTGPYTVAAGQQAVRVSEIQFIPLGNQFNGTKHLYAKTCDLAGNEGTGSDSIQIDTTQRVVLMSGYNCASGGTVFVSYDFPDPPEETVYAEPEWGDPMIVGNQSNQTARAQKFVLTESTRITHVEPGLQSPAYAGSPGALFIHIADSLDPADPSPPGVLASAALSIGDYTNAGPRAVFNQELELAAGTYYCIVECPLSNTNNYWILNAGVSIYGGSEEPRYDYFPGTGWTEATTAGDGLGWTGSSTAFYQIPFDLIFHGGAQARWAIDGGYEAQPWQALDELPDTVMLLEEGSHTLWVQYTNTYFGGAAQLFRDSILIDNTGPEASAVLTRRDESMRQLHFAINASDPLAGIQDWVDWRTGGAWNRTAPLRNRLTLAYGSEAFDAVDFRFTDRVGNQSTVSVPLTGLGDIFPPALALSIDDGSGFTVNTNVTLHLNAADNHSVVSLKVQLLDAEIPVYEGPFVSNMVQALSVPELDPRKGALDGTYTFNTWVADAAGNTSGLAQATVILDREPPVIAGLELHDEYGRTFTATNGFDFLLDAQDEGSAIEYRYAVDAGGWSGWTNNLGRCAVDCLSGDAFAYDLQVEVRDLLGHTVTASGTIVRVHAPVPPLGLCPNTQTMPADLNLVASSFVDPDPADCLVASRWQVVHSGTVWVDAVEISAATTHAVPKQVFEPGRYEWRVCYMDRYGLWSGWSEFTEFLVVDPTDSDKDGLPDEYEDKYLKTRAEDGDDDHDGDGLTNMEEYRAGTLPGDPDSVLKITGFGITTTATVSWQSVPGMQYSLEWRQLLTTGTWSNAGTCFGAAAPANHTTATATAPVNSNSFYRIRMLTE